MMQKIAAISKWKHIKDWCQLDSNKTIKNRIFAKADHLKRIEKGREATA